MKFNIYAFILLFFVSISWSQTKSPKSFLGYELGSRFTRCDKVVDYFKYVAKANTNVKLVNYGETYEHRPLELAFITSPENFAHLESIRANHLKETGLLSGESTTNKIAIVWLSYNVHGNEASSTEASMKTLFALVDPKNKDIKEWLKNTVVILDPCLNPDGRERYVSWYNQKANNPYNINPDDVEHHEPWPGGRVNHYLFDLNRDWAWISQTESAARIKIYNKWLPNVHVDFHEQGINDPYYFAPGAEPYHEVITKFQRDFQVKVGKNNAKYFDKNGWLYFTKEFFDLLYPSYGDTYPMYNGAVGMTYEQAGHSRAGLGIVTRGEDILTLKDRIAHHYTTSLSTIEVASNNAQQLADEFRKYFKESKNNPKGKYQSYVIKGSNGRDKLNSLIVLLDAHKIRYGNPKKMAQVTGFSYQDNRTKKTNLQPADLIINLAQPKAKLVKALFEPQTKLNDSATYDITAWALPYAHGLEALALRHKINTSLYKALPKEESKVATTIPYAYLAKWDAVKDAEFLAYLLQEKVKVRFAKKPFEINKKSYKAGTLIITKKGNKKAHNFNKIVIDASKKYDRTITAVNTGFVDRGKDFGSSGVSFIKKPNIAVLTGKEVSPNSFGEIWHFFEQQLHYPVTNIGTDYFAHIDLYSYNVLVIPNGHYSKTLNKDNLGKIQDWIKAGGKLIVIDHAINPFAKSGDFAVSHFASNKAKAEAADFKETFQEELALMPFEDQERSSLSNNITGSVFKATLDNTHPLGFGYPKHYYTLKLNTNLFSYLDKGYNVSVIKNKSDLVSGFVGKNALQKTEKSLVFGVEQKGKGQVIYLADNPLFRSFWQNGKLIFCNALFFVGQQ
ncbi:MAG: zinc carboxypeptidase [Flavobacteriaceae bacterium]|nr:zinc carboxypeptidase [Flavobacteriaceae bacterium]